MNDDKLYLIHISESIALLKEFTKDGKESFLNSELIQSAVIYKVQTMAESTTRLSEEMKAKHPEIDWMNIRGFRNRLVHGYLGTDLEIVWSVVEKYLEPLKVVVEAMLAELEDRQ
jgi:uncharacterized protein with HEPN domain